MNLEQFKKLTMEEQSDAIFEFASMVTERRDRNFRYLLYHLYSFYIERKYDISTGELIDLFGFESDDTILDLYIKDIDLGNEGIL